MNDKDILELLDECKAREEFNYLRLISKSPINSLREETPGLYMPTFDDERTRLHQALIDKYSKRSPILYDFNRLDEYLYEFNPHKRYSDKELVNFAIQLRRLLRDTKI